jgi:hypothetical protein
VPKLVGLRVLASRDGSGELIVAPSRGRVLRANAHGENGFWTNPDTTTDWNLGGDRLWLAPESSWHWKTIAEPDFSQYEIPRAMDPGGWRITDVGSGYVSIRHAIALNHRRSNDELRAVVRRVFTLVDLEGDKRRLGAIADRTDNSLEVIDGRPGQVVGIWSIVQVPNGGTIDIATGGHPTPRKCFGEVPTNIWHSTPGRLQVDLGSRETFKIGLSPEDATGRWVYVRPAPGGFLVVARRFFSQPWLLYADAPLGQLESQGDALQLYNDDGSNGGFAEVETHSPAIVIGRGPKSVVDSSLTVVALIRPAKLDEWLDEWMTGSGPQAVLDTQSIHR